MTTTVNVSGMTCGHCVSSVKEELSEVPGVTAVDVDLNSGGISPVTIESTGDLDPQAVTEAVAEAGYSVV
ncbi:heavy-metal-associated domain-containing protein [Glutamicibacter protophormiae]|uniref:Copper chaperone CopZ n=1 Tax=Kocuria varians TaxID=1272 RepID=A0A7D7Q2G9_KOCVA|nr:MULTISPECIES: heavy-metal-associated domain-containing protein [Kocuria]WNB88590.1 heavy-metal-associated domain-containing protein [Glutamicibacter protophormiae]MDN5631659.1 heavy-metal-associated domain-containing protein [Kocuria sp.]QMS55897.1 Copper chaperone CopZ [Kocuria varians]RUP83703.1 copper chaperone [Kocuria sp. HSID17590]RUQ07356.1 copper chaperone [Kocuria sp. HSID17582]